jgi:biopolymer transport protein ExbD
MRRKGSLFGRKSGAGGRYWADSPEMPKINMTPMIDCTFLLIIFFMLVSEMASRELEEIALPHAATFASGATATRSTRLSSGCSTPAQETVYTGQNWQLHQKRNSGICGKGGLEMSKQSRKMREEAISEEPELMMTPMVDIVFQLLIFFMLACRFRTTDGQLDTYLPKNRGQGTASTPDVPFRPVRIKLLWVIPGTTRETRDPVNGQTLLKIEQIRFRNVRNRFGEAMPDYQKLYSYVCRARDLYPPTKTFPTLPVIIDSRPQVPFKHVIYAANECIRAGIKDLTFAKEEIDY